MHEARRGGAKKQQKKSEWDENMAKVSRDKTQPPSLRLQMKAGKRSGLDWS